MYNKIKKLSTNVYTFFGLILIKFRKVGIEKDIKTPIFSLINISNIPDINFVKKCIKNRQQNTIFFNREG